MKLASPLFLLTLFFPLFSVFAAPGDAEFLLAREAFRVGDGPRFERAAAQLGEHELLPYVEYYRLRMQFEQTDDAPVQAYLTRHAGTWMAEKMRSDWLRQLAKRERWQDLEMEATKLRSLEQDTQCLVLRARLMRKDSAALDEIRPLWLKLLDPGEWCQPVLEALIWEKRLTADDVWERVRRQVEIGRVNWARNTLAYLPASQTPASKEIDQLFEKPALYLARLPARWQATQMRRELVALAVQRLAVSDPVAAAAQLETIQDRLQDSERSWAWSQVGLQAARRHLPEALAWYAKAGKFVGSPEATEWKTRAALRTLDWEAVRTTIEAMPAELAGKPEWIYWLGRAYRAAGRMGEADALFMRLTDQPSFYGNLADEELGRRIVAPIRARALTYEEIARIEADAGLKRALALFRLDLRTEAVREWNYSLYGLGDRELLAAADLARRHHIYDRAINTAERTRGEHDYNLRYLSPYVDQVRPAVRNQSLDDAWVYGLMRQESRFISNAKSSAGASGLMQLMPATARWVAKKIGLQDYQHGRVNDPEVNLLLGTSYLRMVMQSLDNHPVLASAAYNAGPSRARRWQDVKPLEGAIYAETIPFSETRDYVKKVLSNAIYYSSQFNGQPDSLKARLGTVPPRGTPAAGGEELP